MELTITNIEHLFFPTHPSHNDLSETAAPDLTRTLVQGVQWEEERTLQADSRLLDGLH